MSGHYWPQNHKNETLGVKKFLKCFTRAITQGYFRKLHKILFYDYQRFDIKIILALSLRYNFPERIIQRDCAENQDSRGNPGSLLKVLTLLIYF